MINIKKLIPHRPPFLYVDEVISIETKSIKTKYHLKSDLEIFAGHYPDFPIFPGVLICESIFQTAAILLVSHLAEIDQNLVPIITRIKDVKFKYVARPNDDLILNCKIEDIVSNAFYMKGSAEIDSKQSVTASFTCAMINKSDIKR
ncbi:MAG: 3-hydroxyacyl-ACP dehydratase FabZ family protein [Nitrospinota bacterium]